MPYQKGKAAMFAAWIFAAVLLAAPAWVSPAAAEDDHVQVVLNDGLVKGFIAAQKDVAAIAPKLQKAGDNVSPELEAELDALAKKHGFKSFEELEDVSFTINLVMDGYDADSGNFNEPKEQLKKELAAVKADKSIPADEKSGLVADLEAALKSTPALQHKENVAVVKKNKAAIDKATGRD